MTAKNDVLNEEEMDVKPTGLPSEEVIAMSQEDLIAGLLAAADYDTNEEAMKKIQIKRDGKLFFEFKVHALSESELIKLRKKSTKKYNNPGGKHLPKIEGDADMAEFRSRKIYAATADDDRAKLWDNPRVKAGLIAKGKDIVENFEIIDAVLMGGEKFNVSELIDELSGYKDETLELEEYAKN